MRLDSEQVSNDSCYSHTDCPVNLECMRETGYVMEGCLIQTLPALHLGVNVMEGV
jgi:hypothetical protein